MRSWLLSSLLIFLLAGCETKTPVISATNALRPPVFDAGFRRVWEDGASEVLSYETVRMRGGISRKGTATSVTRRAAYSEDERVPVTSPKRRQEDLFAAIEMHWLERHPEGSGCCEEMTSVALAMSSVNGRAAGALAKVNFSSHSWDGQLFHQLLFDTTGVRSHQYSYFENEGDEQITLPYPRDGISADALWLWARRMAAPLLEPGEQRSIELLTSLHNARSQHHPLTWIKGTLTLAREGKSMAGRPVSLLTAQGVDGYAETFYVESALPFRVLHWENSVGERADFVSGNRIGSKDSHLSSSLRMP